MSGFNNIENNPKLKQNSFKVPEGYFENMEARLHQIAAAETKVVPLKPAFSPARIWSMAASFALLFAASWYFWPNESVEIPVELSAEDVASLSANGFLHDAETYFLESVSLDELDQIVLTENDYSDYFEITQPDALEDYYLETDI
jgi:hypothetical protein